MALTLPAPMSPKASGVAKIAPSDGLGWSLGKSELLTQLELTISESGSIDKPAKLAAE